MIKITGVYVRKDGLYLLYSGEDAVALLDYKAIEQFGIAKGSTFDEELFCEIVYQSDCRRCKSKAVDLLSRRDYCKKELYIRLCRDFDSEAAQYAVRQCVTLHYVDDERYSQNLAESLLKNKHYSPYRTVRELCSRGVDSAVAQNAVDFVLEQTEYDQIDEICEYIGKKYSGFAEDEKIKRRCFNALQRLGYSQHDIFEAMDVYIAEFM